MDECGNCRNLKKGCDTSGLNLKTMEPKSVMAGFVKQIRMCLSKVTKEIKKCKLVQG